MSVADLKQMKRFIYDSRTLLKKNNQNVPEYILNPKSNRWELSK